MAQEHAWHGGQAPGSTPGMGVSITYFLTGLQFSSWQGQRCGIESVSTLVQFISEYVTTGVLKVEYPAELDRFLVESDVKPLSLLNEDLKTIYSAVVGADSQDNLVAAYHRSRCLRDLWGAPYDFSKML